MTGVEENAIAQFAVFSRKWFPARNVTTRSMGEALFLEKDFWQKQGKAVANGIAMAFKG